MLYIMTLYARFVSITLTAKKMKSYALAMSTFSTPTLKIQTTVNQNIKPMIQLNNYSRSSKSTNSLLPFCFQSYKLANVSFTSSLLTSSSSNFSCNKENLLQLCRPNRILNEFKGRASVSASVLESSENESSLKESKLARTLQLVAMFVIWYSLNIFFNIYNKQVLKVFPYPATLTAFQFGCGTVMILVMWGFNLYPKPKLKRSHVIPILTLALVHTFGNFLTNISLGKVAVSFTHTIKAMEPFFAVIFSVLFLSEWPTFWVIVSLAPIVGGVVLASFTEASFNWIGFASAMASNMTNQSRNVLSKKFMIRKEDRLDNISLFSMLTITSFILLFPIAIIVEGVKFTPSFLQHYTASHGLSLRDLFLKALLSGFCFHSYQQVSYMILEMVSAVTHSVANSVKRVVLIVSSVLFFRTPVSLINSLGTGLALAGVFLYSRVKQLKPKQKI